MNVRQLIEALSALDPDLPVIIPGPLDFVTVEQVFLDVVAPERDGALQLCDYDDDGCMTIARLFGTGEFDDRDERPKPPTN